MTRRQAVINGGSLALAAAAAALAVAFTRPGDWSEPTLFAVLLALALVSDTMTADLRGVRLSGAFLAIVLAMALLGPAPAAAIGASCCAFDALFFRRPLTRAVQNLANYTLVPVAGAVLLGLAVGDVAPRDAGELEFALAVLVAYLLTNALIFLVVAGYKRLNDGSSLLESFRDIFLPILPSEAAIGLMAAAVAFSYGRIGIGALMLLAVVMFVFQYVNRTGVRARERGKELSLRTRELASLQVGLLSTVVQTLSMRDAMTARHSAAVARYAREVAKMMGLPEREQELIHTAALLHDIGKFIFPDSILFADRKLTDDEWEVVKLHPEQGAKLLRRIQGYGPVAEIVLSHHERFGGGGYPNGIAGEEIPLGSRIISAADTYDVMTSRDSYRRPVSPEAALAELKRVAGTQLDPQVVEVFTRMILERGVSFEHADEADFEQELALERRIADYARPRVAV